MSAFTWQRARAFLSRFFLLGLTLGSLVSAATPPADKDAAKDSPPGAADQQAAHKSIDALYKQQLGAAKTRDAKSALAKTLLGVGREEKDVAARYELLTTSRRLAVEAGDAESAFAAVAQLVRFFDIDPWALQNETFAALAKTVTSPAGRAVALTQAKPLIDAAIAAERYDVARQSVEVALKLAKSGNDKSVEATYQKLLLDLSSRDAAYKAAREASKVLEKNAEDPPANLAVGKYRCLYAGDWKTGLPLLALSGDAQLQPLAKSETAGPATAAQQITLADGWYDYGKKHLPAGGTAALQHARDVYEAAAIQQTGLEKAKTLKRIAEIAAITPPRIVDLLKLVDPARDAKASGWHLDDGKLFNDPAGTAELRFPYLPPAEYDVTLEYVRDDGQWGAALIVCRNGKLGPSTLPCREHPEITAVLPAGQPAASFTGPPVDVTGTCKLSIHVRKDDLQAYYKDVKYIDRHVPSWQLDKGWLAPEPVALGVILFYGKITITKAELTEISGPGTILK